MGMVKNLDDKKTVEIFAEHEDMAIIRRFVEKIKLEIENRESIEAGAIYMRKLATEMKMTREELGNKMDEGFTKLGDKLDKFSNNTSKRFDVMEQKF